MTSPAPQTHGFDAAVTRREDDQLNRWPFAREIYGIATGPRDWSVRVGIYGEWGTGKTSVLEFIEAMARRDGQIVIRFNPWEHSTKDALWRAFVLAIFKQPRLAKAAGAKLARAKGLLGSFLKRARIIEAGTGVWSEKAAKGVGVGLELVKSFLGFNEKDLKSFREGLGEKRVIVLVDDLDRTAAELVPEILFALKQLMNIPGFSFVCAFDPAVVGQVLRDHHPGFGDGLKFLEKVIDYPRWLPPPPPAGLAALAIADAKRYCEYVPETELRDALQLLPPNPRSIRQFIRLLALLGPQIQRHNADELRWSSILAANVIKIRQPRLAHELLNDVSFWDRIEAITILDRDEQQTKLTEALNKQVDTVAARQNVSLTQTEKTEIVEAMIPLCSTISLWFGGGAEAQVYQMNIAEFPHGVTWKEFNEFVAAWNRAPSSGTADQWIGAHSATVERPPKDVYQELLCAALDRYPKILRSADSVRREADRPPLLEEAKTLVAIVECLLLDMAPIGPPDNRVGPAQLEKLFDSFTTILKSSPAPTNEFCTRNEALLHRIIERWQGDVTSLVDVILPYGQHWSSARFDGTNARALHDRLSNAVLPKLALQAIAGLRQAGYVQQRVWTQDTGNFQVRCVFLTPDSPLWCSARNDLLAVLQEAGTNQAIQENAYELLYWFEHLLRERGATGDATNVKNLLSQKPILDGIWSAATARPLSPRTAAGLNQFVLRLGTIGANLVLPAWWDDAIKRSGCNPAPAAQPGQTGQHP